MLKIPFKTLAPSTRMAYKIVFNHMCQRYPNLIWEDFGHFHPWTSPVMIRVPTFKYMQYIEYACLQENNVQ